MNKTTGKVTGIVSNLVTVAVDGPVSQNEICYIDLDGTHLMAEVIKVNGSNAAVQVFESTRGLKNGNKVVFENKMLEVTLGPGLLSSCYDGLQNNLTTMTGVFLKRGEYTEPLDHEKLWDFTPIAKEGDKVVAADWLGEVKEGWLPHKIMVPFSFKGEYTVKSVAAAGQYKIDDTMAVLVNENGEEVRKPIENIAVGTLVLAYDEATGEKAYKPGVKLFRNETKRWCTVTVEVDGQKEQIVSTPGHKYYLPNNTENREIGFSIVLLKSL